LKFLRGETVFHRSPVDRPIEPPSNDPPVASRIPSVGIIEIRMWPDEIVHRLLDVLHSDGTRQKYDKQFMGHPEFS
jgi:hypothetical protein